MLLNPRVTDRQLMLPEGGAYFIDSEHVRVIFIMAGSLTANNRYLVCCQSVTQFTLWWQAFVIYGLLRVRSTTCDKGL
jgi:hypothetical protein